MNIARLQEFTLALRDCLCTTLEAEVEAGRNTGVCVCSVLPGQSVPFDYCAGQSASGERCGMAWVIISSITADSEEGGVRMCIPPMLATVSVGILRGAMFDDLPDSDDNLALWLQQMKDMQTLAKALYCCDKGRTRFTVSDYTPIGPEGGCYGGQFNLTVEA